MSRIRVKYLDASALVKLVVDEGDHANLRRYFHENAHFCGTTLCFGEAIGAIKAKWVHNRMSEQQYFEATRRLTLDFWSDRIEVDEVNIFSPIGQQTVEALAKRHSIDISDALQLATIMGGKYSFLVEESSSVLITADRKLAEAAVAEGVQVWDCHATVWPSWA